MKTVFFSFLLLMGSIRTFAQLQPTHDLYVNPFYHGTETLDETLNRWRPGEKFNDNDNFFISRVKFKQRFTNTATDASMGINPKRQLIYWIPVGEDSKVWQSIPRYNFNADVFSTWSYIDTHGGWGQSFWSIPAAFSDVANKNGVRSGGMLWFNSAQTNAIISGWYGADAATRDNNAKQFLRLMKYYGYSCIGYNTESSISSENAKKLKEFHAALYRFAKEEGADYYLPQFQQIWYEGMNNDGRCCGWIDQLNNTNVDWFDYQGEVTSDAYFLNYNWGTSKLNTSIATATGKSRNTFDIYAGLDFEKGLNKSWTLFKDFNVSVGIWGGHAINPFLKGATERGTGDVAMQEVYQKKLELFFNGGRGNPASLPAVTNNHSPALPASGSGGLYDFFGMASFVTAKSTLDELPFVTRFNLGNGLFFNNEGKRTFNHKWYNWGMQDWMPTWRWWIVDNSGAAETSTPIKAKFQFEDAWFGGSCVQFSGATTFSDVRLFKTKFSNANNAEMAITYKLKTGTQSNMSLIFSKVGSETEFTSIPVGNPETTGVWTTATFDLSTYLTESDQIALVGIRFENTPANYDVLLGELSIIPKSVTYIPKKAEILVSQKLEGKYNAQDFKLVWQAEGKSAYAFPPVMNSDVDTWYWEIYFEETGQEKVLVTTTTSWAGYVVNAPVKVAGSEIRWGVCAVAPDGKTKSDIVWTQKETHDFVSAANIILDKVVIKPNEQFTLKFVDPTKTAASRWIIKDQVGVVRNTTNNQTFVTTSLVDPGFYSIEVTHTPQGGVEQTDQYKDYVLISPEEVGSLPVVSEVTSNPTSFTKETDVTYTASIDRLGEGGASVALKIADPYTFKVPGSMISTHTFTVAYWLKFDNLMEGSEGIHLFNKRDPNSSWPGNNWGDIWCEYRTDKLPAGLQKFSFNSGASFTSKGDVNGVLPNNDVAVDKWYHVCYVQDGTAKTRRIYFNGIEMTPYYHNGVMTGNGGTVAPVGTAASAGTATRDIYVGGAAANRTGFTGWIDEFQIWDKALSAAEVKTALNGFTTDAIPENLKGYWTFENQDSGGKFANLGNGASAEVVYGKLDVNGQNATFTPYPQESSVGAGCPLISGNLLVTTLFDWEFEDGSGNVNNQPAGNINDKTAVTNFTTVGGKKVKFILKNSWTQQQDTTLWKGNIKEVTANVLYLDATLSSSAFSPLTGNATVNVTSNGTWSATSNQTWLTLTDATNQAGNRSFVLNVTQNNTPADRNATLTIKDNNLSTITKSFVITQEAPALDAPTEMAYALEAGSNTLTFTTNSTWLVTTTDDWITLPAITSGTGDATLSIAVTANSSDRTGSVTVSVPGLPPHIVTIKQTLPLVMPTFTGTLKAASNSKGTIGVSSNAQWAVTVDAAATWLTIESGASGTNNGTTIVNAARNTTTQNRSAILTYTVVGGADKTITVTQDAPTITLSETGTINMPNTVSTKDITVTSNADWNINSSDTWLTITNISAGSFKVNTAVNPLSVARTATITVTVEGLSDIILTVEQAAGAATLTADLPAAAAKEATTVNVVIRSNVKWNSEVIEGSSWITIPVTNGENNGTLQLSLSANLANQRTGKIRISSTSAAAPNVDIAIIQRGTYNLQATVERNFTSLANDIITVTVESNLGEAEAGWVLNTTDISWTEITDIADTQNKKIFESNLNQQVKLITLRPNSGTVKRTGIVTITAQNSVLGIAPVNLTITQDPSSVTSVTREDDLQISVYPNPTSNILHIEMTEGRVAQRVVVGNIAGNILLDRPLNNSTAFEIDLSKQPAGIYTINLYLPDNKVLIKKIIKQ